ncbi:phosphoenolpyruvate--protein phosphotransferase, partial [Acidobacteria bacterium AH-259-L09]|nr:phosphoenolpyruvate--protein phosphotransferase [Acidobacteria bacterium AH-259-L09]
AYRVELQTGAFYRIRISPEECSSELRRLRTALKQSRRQLQQAKRKFEAEVGKEHSYIIDAHLLILEDRHLVEQIEKKIKKELQSPERAVREAAENWLSAYRSLDDPFFQERGSDLEEVVERIISNLMELNSQTHAGLPEDLILVAPEVSLFLLAEYPLERLKGLVLRKGGSTSHGIIVARSYRIPVVSGVPNVEAAIRTGDTLIVDGSSGVVLVRPSQSEIRTYEARMREEKKRQLSLVGDQSPCVTLDGRRVFLYGNAETASEVLVGLRLGAEGIGLFRSEYIYMQDKKAPVGEEEQFKVYKSLAQQVGDRPAIVRTLDFGDERHPYFSSILAETEAVLGLRGIRLSLQYPEIFKNQVRALLRASAHGNLKIVIPMVSSVDEIIQGKQLIQEAQQELLQEGVVIDRGIEIGIMVEVPAAIVMLEAIAAHADFFAVGTNDLIQYTLAASRTDHRIAYLFNPLHPAVLKSLDRVARVAAHQNSMVLVCGEVASHPVYASLLVGMGFQHLSMNPFAIPEIKQILREIVYFEVRETVNHILSLPTLEEVEGCVNERFSGLKRLTAEQLTS